MNLTSFLSYPVYYDPASDRARRYVLDHFYRIRSNTRFRQLRKTLVRPFLPLIEQVSRKHLEHHPRFSRLDSYLEGKKIEVVIDARRFFRLIDFAGREVINIFKDDDLPLYFQNEVRAREVLSGADFIPRLISVDETEKIYSEEYVCERPFKSFPLGELDPENFGNRQRQILRQVRGALPARKMAAGEYAGGMAEKILRRPEANQEIRRYVECLLDKARGLGEIELVFSHGDFRKDQIFFAGDGSLKVIDWECSGYFSRYYDPAELYLTERWFYTNPVFSAAQFLDSGCAPLKELFALYLLELCFFPIRFHREFLLTRSLPILKKVEERIRRHVLPRS